MNTTGFDSVSSAVGLFDDAVLRLDLLLAIVLANLLLIAICTPQAIALVGSLLVRLRHEPGKSMMPGETMPHLSSTIPWIGHALSLRTRGARYLIQLMRSTPAPVFSINILSTRFVVVSPSADKSLARHVHDTSLPAGVALIGQRALGMTAQSVQTIAWYNPRPLHAQLFESPAASAGLVQITAAFLRNRLRSEPRVQHVQLGHWMSSMIIAATAHAVWGPRNPWNDDPEFARQFVILSDRLETLAQPLPWLTARKALHARDFLFQRLVAFHREHRESRVASVAHRINTIPMRDDGWESNGDYYRCEILESLGLLVTGSALAVWLIRHLLVDDELRRTVTDEVRRLKPTADDGRLDVSDLRTTCPHLVAAWHEALRLHMSFVPRVALRAFTIDAPSIGAVAIEKGDVILEPMLAFNTDPATWGPNTESFSAARFLDSEGRVSTQRTRKVRAFGVAGNLCPGRVLGFETAMVAVTSLLNDFDIKPIAGAAFPPPTTMKGPNIGFERMAQDVRVTLARVDAH